ncbi:MAG: AAA family ATPase [Actinomycetes bacterium]
MAAEHQPIVTIFEQYGAGGSEVAERLAGRLGVPFLHQAVSSEDLEEAEAEARAGENAFERFLRAFSPLPTADADITWALEEQYTHEIVLDNTRRVLDAVDQTGGVLVGRNATVILADAPLSLHVKLIGPVEARVARAAHESGIDLATARRRQEREDRVRAEMSRHLYQWDPTTDQAYDLVVDTGAFTIDQTVDLIEHAFRLKYPA